VSTRFADTVPAQSRGLCGGAWYSFLGRLFAPVDIASLVVFRIAFGEIMVWEMCRYFYYGWVGSYYVEHYPPGRELSPTAPPSSFRSSGERRTRPDGNTSFDRETNGLSRRVEAPSGLTDFQNKHDGTARGECSSAPCKNKGEPSLFSAPQGVED
jgi:hypothetical protein